jgi:hypothetical protein
MKLTQEKWPELAESEAAFRAEKIALAAIKFYILSFTPASTVKFDPEASLAFSGKAGTCRPPTPLILLLPRLLVPSRHMEPSGVIHLPPPHRGYPVPHPPLLVYQFSDCVVIRTLFTLSIRPNTINSWKS